MGILEEYDELKPSRGDFKVYEADENHIVDSNDSSPLCGWVRTRSDVDFILFAYRNLPSIINSIRKAQGIVASLQNELSELKQSSEKYEILLKTQDEIIKKFKDVTRALIDPEAGLFTLNEVTSIAKELLNETGSKGT